MASVVEICNLALEHVGRAGISSIDEESAEAQRCKLHYDQARKRVLSTYKYRFQRKVLAMAQLAENNRSDRWGFAYQAPVDVLTVRRILSAYTGATDVEHAVVPEVPYEYEEGTIYCDVEAAVLEYCSSDIDAQRYPALVVDAIASELASRIAYPLTRDRQVRGDMLQLAQSERLKAEMWDANQSVETSKSQTEFINARA